MQELVNELKHRRKAVDSLKQLVKDAQCRLEKTEHWEMLQVEKEALAHAEKEMQLVDTRLREEAIKSYQKTGNKKPVNGISIIILKALDYHTEQAIDWVIHNARDTMLKLDKRAFEKHAKAVAETVPLDFVNITEKPSVRIAKELYNV